MTSPLFLWPGLEAETEQSAEHDQQCNDTTGCPGISVVWCLIKDHSDQCDTEADE